MILALIFYLFYFKLVNLHHFPFDFIQVDPIPFILLLKIGKSDVFLVSLIMV